MLLIMGVPCICLFACVIEAHSNEFKELIEYFHKTLSL